MEKKKENILRANIIFVSKFKIKWHHFERVEKSGKICHF